MYLRISRKDWLEIKSNALFMSININGRYLGFWVWIFLSSDEIVIFANDMALPFVNSNWFGDEVILVKWGWTLERI